MRYVLGMMIMMVSLVAEAMPIVPEMPTPNDADVPKTLTLREAILLSLRFNPTVQTAELNRITQKFSLEVSKWAFDPQYSFSLARTWNSAKAAGVPSASKSWTATPGMTWNSAIGTTTSVASNNTWGQGSRTANYNPSVVFTITQPLLKGFGEAVTLAALEDAYDTEKVNRLNLKGTVIAQVTSTIQAYITVIKDKENLAINIDALKRAKESLKQTEELIKAGRNARSDAIQGKSQVASAAVNVQSAKNTLQLDTFSLLDQLGLKPSSNLMIDDTLPLNIYSHPLLKESETMALQNNITYQVSVIGIASVKRALLLAQDGMRWSLNLGETYTVGGGTGGGANAGVNSLENRKNYNSATTLTLTVPIDDMTTEQALLTQTIALQEAEMNLHESKRQLVIGIMGQVNSINNEAEQVHLDEEALKLAQQLMINTQKQYKAGVVSSLAVTQQSTALTQAEQQVVNDRISYFQSLSSFDQEIGHAVETWGLSVNY